MPLNIEYNSGFQPSSFINSVNPEHGATGVDTDTNFEVILNVTPQMDSIISDNFRLELSDSGERFEFNPINYGIDWHPIQKKLLLRLDRALQASEEYTLIIENLYNAAGDEMDSPFVMMFRTSDIQKVVSEEIDTGNLLISEDRSLVDNDIFIETADHTGDDVYLVSSTPTTLSYNVSGASIGDIIYLIFNEDLRAGLGDIDEYKPYVSFKRKLISVHETAWQEFNNEWHVYHEDNILTIGTLDEFGAPVPLELGEGYEYEIVINKNIPFGEIGSETTLTNDVKIYFISELPNMFTNVNSVLLYFPTFEPYDVAKHIYLNSQMVSFINPSISITNGTAINYVKYATLYQVGTLNDGLATRIVLGDLQVDMPDGTLLDRWESLMTKAEAALMRKKPLWAVKGENHPSAHQATRNWDF